MKDRKKSEKECKYTNGDSSIEKNLMNQINFLSELYLKRQHSSFVFIRQFSFHTMHPRH
jgi:hypothetical protein